MTDDSEVLNSDFPGLGTFAASLTSKNLLILISDWIIPGTKMTNTCPFFWNGSSKIPFFTNI